MSATDPRAPRSAQRPGRTPVVTPILDLQLNQAVLSWPELRDRAAAADAAGYGALWVFDHLAGQCFDGDSMLEAFALLGALATATTSLELGVMVANVNNRSPATLVVAAATVQSIAGRAFHLGIGAGGPPDSPW
ncbi:MAG: LLM class flavin-dependent oxidoreductase, partial [Ilumatobacteraceae bacterium]